MFNVFRNKVWMWNVNCRIDCNVSRWIFMQHVLLYCRLILRLHVYYFSRWKHSSFSLIYRLLLIPLIVSDKQTPCLGESGASWAVRLIITWCNENISRNEEKRKRNGGTERGKYQRRREWRP